MNEIENTNLPSIKVLSLNCNHCGAPLEIPADTRFITCMFCASRLEVRQTGDICFTKVIEELSQRTEALGQQVEQMTDGLMLMRAKAVLEELEAAHAKWRKENIPETQIALGVLILMLGSLFMVPAVMAGSTYGCGMSGFTVLVGIMLLVLGIVKNRRLAPHVAEFKQKELEARSRVAEITEVMRSFSPP